MAIKPDQSSRKSIVRFGQTSRPKPAHEPKKSITLSEEDLDMINIMETKKGVCFICKNSGHYMKDCKASRSLHHSRLSKFRNSKGKFKQKFFSAEDAPDGNDSASDEDNGSTSETSNESALSDEDDGESESFNCISYYQIENPSEVSAWDGVQTKKLPIYKTMMEGEPANAIIDSGCTTLFIAEKLAKKIGLEIVKIKPRKVKVADKKTQVITGMTKVDVKIGNLPIETLIVYVFPLASINLVLGLPWLQKHNPGIDWRTMAFEFTRNGRRYQLYPAKPPTTNLRIVESDEFQTFVNNNPALYTLVPKTENLQGNRAYRRQVLRWIQKYHKRLLRKLGEPSNLESFAINTGDAESIQIRPRPYSPLDLEKIKAFIDENLANGVISESDSPWSFPIVLAAKPNGDTRVCVDYRALN